MSSTHTTTITHPGRADAGPSGGADTGHSVARRVGSARVAVPIGVAVATVVNLAVYGFSRSVGAISSSWTVASPTG